MFANQQELAYWKLKLEKTGSTGRLEYSSPAQTTFTCGSFSSFPDLELKWIKSNNISIFNKYMFLLNFL